jgi:hypothetical protein
VRPADRDTVERDGAVVVLDQPAENPEEGRLPAAARTDDRDELAAMDVEGDPFECGDPVARRPVPLRDAV